MEMSGPHSHYQNGGLPGYGGMMGHIMHLLDNGGIGGNKHDGQDDLDLDSLVNGLSLFPTALDTDERHLLQSHEDLNESDYEPTDYSSSPPLYDSRYVATLTKVSSPIQVRRIQRQHCSLVKSKSLPIQKSMKNEIPDPFPDIGGYQQSRIGTSMEDCFYRNHDNRKDQESTPSENSIPIKIYCEDGSWKVATIIVEPSHTAMDVCRTMVMKKNTLEDKNWSLVEHLTDQGLERTLEDHEKVIEVYTNWSKATSNKLYFRKNFRKYEIFQNPCQFFPMHMLEMKGELEGLSEKAERTKQVLLQNLFLKGDKVPEIQGFLHSHDGHKRSWKKHYFVLRQSGLYYSTKGSSKDPKHLTCYVQFDHVQLHYAINGKKQYHSPTEYVFSIRPNKSHLEQKEVKYFCSEDEQTRQCWLAGMRLVSSGKQLSDNYQTARKMQALGREMDLQTSSWRIENRNDRVAIDFSGHSGRIIRSTSEAIAIAEREGVEWSRRSGRPVDSPRNSPRHASSSPRYTASSPRPVTNSPRIANSPRFNCMTGGSPRYMPFHNGCSPIMKRRLHTGIDAGIHVTQPWYHSGISRDETQGLFMKQGMVDGLFLIRESQRLPGTYVLSFSQNQRVKHYQIQLMEEDSKCYVTLDEGTTKFNDLVQLVEFYRMNAGGLPTRLLHVCTKL